MQTRRFCIHSAPSFSYKYPGVRGQSPRGTLQPEHTPFLVSGTNPSPRSGRKFLADSCFMKHPAVTAVGASKQLRPSQENSLEAADARPTVAACPLRRRDGRQAATARLGRISLRPRPVGPSQTPPRSGPRKSRPDVPPVEPTFTALHAENGRSQKYAAYAGSTFAAHFTCGTVHA